VEYETRSKLSDFHGDVNKNLDPGFLNPDK